MIATSNHFVAFQNKSFCKIAPVNFSKEPFAVHQEVKSGTNIYTWGFDGVLKFNFI
jgi:hypothetical protein